MKVIYNIHFKNKIEIGCEKDDYLFFSENKEEIDKLTSNFFKMNIFKFYDFITHEIKKRNYKS